jgi:RNA polymerase-binding protein DksA
VVKKKSPAKKKAVAKKPVAKKKKAASAKKTKSVKKKAPAKKTAAKKGKSVSRIKAKAKTKTKVKAKKAAKPKKAPVKAKKAPAKAKKAAVKKIKKGAPKKPSLKKKTAVKKAVKSKSSPAVEETEIPEIEKPAVVKKFDKSIKAIVGKIRERLLENRAEVLKMLESSQAMERDVDGLTFSNEIDLASSLEGREMVFHLSSRDRKELKLIDDALIKIEKQTYGVCESCEKMISVKRLQILPLTALCIECQESAEHH